MAEKKSSNAMDPLLQAILMYLFAPITGLIWMNETDDLVRFHARQSLYWGLLNIIVWVLITVLSAVFIGVCLMPIWGLVYLGGTIYMIVEMNKGNKTKLPIIGDMAEKNV